jgi:uncharacterized LabA/DUF88 family protein
MKKQTREQAHTASARRTPNRPVIRTARAPQHGALANDLVHVFVDDQNLFFGIVNSRYGLGFRIDFGRLLLVLAQATDGRTRGVGSAYVAGVIPDDDSFWEVWKNHGFEVRRGFLGANRRSKQDDAYLIRDMTLTVAEKPGPSTIVLVAGDADYGPPLELAVERGWRCEVAFIDRGISTALEAKAHEFRNVVPTAIQHLR